MIYQSPKVNHGFVTIHLILILGILLVIFFSFSFLSFISQAKIQFRSICLSDSVELQKKIIRAEKQLFLLNPVSTLLKNQLLAAEAELALASAGGPLAVQLIAQILEIKARQQQLQQLQTGIILSTDQMIQSEKLISIAKIKSANVSLGETWSTLVYSSFTVDSDSTTSMAVKAKTSEEAPNYELDSHYRSIQAMAFNWQLKYFTNPKSQKLLSSQNSFSISCGTAPLKNGDKWSVEIQKDKFY